MSEMTKDKYPIHDDCLEKAEPKLLVLVMDKLIQSMETGLAPPIPKHCFVCKEKLGGKE